MGAACHWEGLIHAWRLSLNNDLHDCFNFAILLVGAALSLCMGWVELHSRAHALASRASRRPAHNVVAMHTVKTRGGGQASPPSGLLPASPRSQAEVGHVAAVAALTLRFAPPSALGPLLPWNLPSPPPLRVTPTPEGPTASALPRRCCSLPAARCARPGRG